MSLYFFDWLQIIMLLLFITIAIKPFGRFMARVFSGEKTFLSRALVPVEYSVYKLAGLKSDEEMSWKGYLFSIMAFNLIGFFVLWLILLIQGYLPLNPEKLPGFSSALAFNTAISFMTNTNWQAYSGETTASYFSQMCGLAVQNFLSAATGICVAIAVIRGFARHTSSKIGNFWVDLTRCCLYILIPISIIAALFFVSQGIIQNFNPYVKATLIQPFADSSGKLITEQTIPMGPAASQVAIKMFGSNGGGFFNANSSHPFENPTILCNFVQIFLILLIAAGLTYTFGEMINRRREGWAIYITMLAILALFLIIMYWSEITGNPMTQRIGMVGEYMEGKEVRFGTGGTVLFGSATTAVSCGAVNSMHDSLTPVGGMMPMTLILLGEIIFGGVGSGLYTMFAFVIIAMFIAGLMIGRIPEYLGKKIEPLEMWMSVITVLTSCLLVLIFVSISLSLKTGLSSMLNPGAHGLSETIYAWGSMSNNNGSAFAGLNASTPFYCIFGGIAMFLGRFLPIGAMLAIAGSFASKKTVPPTSSTLSSSNALFVLWLIGIILIVGALSYFPLLSLGPIIEHLIMRG